MKSDQVEEGEITDMVKDSGKDRDRPRSKSGSQTRSKEAERRISKFSSDKPIEVPKKPLTKAEVVKSPSSTSGKSEVNSSKLVSTKDEAAAPPVLDKKEIWETVRKYELELAKEMEIEEEAAESCEDLRGFLALVKNMVQLKNSSNSKEDQLDHLKLEGLVLLNKVRNFNRLSKIQLHSVKEKCSAGRSQVDKDHLLLQNLLYEATHLKRQVEAVQEYKGQDEEIDLIPVEEFYEKAPSSISKPDTTANNDHLLRIARLEHEFILRQNLTNSCSQLEKSKEQVASEIEASKKKLDSIRPMLQAVLVSTKPVQDFFGMSSWQDNVDQQLANSLPPPLYILYVQSSAYKYAFPLKGGTLDVTVEGDAEGAKEFVHLIDSDDENSEEESDSDVEMEDNEEDNGDNEMSLRRKNRKGKAFRNNSYNPKEKLVKLHPLRVEWVLKISSGETLVVKFSYAIKLQIVTVNCSLHGGSFTDRLVGSQNLCQSILTDLFPDDNGVESPNPTSFYILRKANVESLSSIVSEIGKPFKWAQKIAGINFKSLVPSPTEPQSNIPNLQPSPKYSSSKIEKTVKEMLLRLSNQANLWNQVRALESKNIVLQPDTRQLFPAKISSHFVSLESYSWSDDETKRLSHLLHETKKLSTSPENHDRFFKATVERGRVRLRSYIMIRMDFPIIPPVFTLVLEKEGEELDAISDSGLQAMERELNLNAPIDYQEHLDMLLLMQVQKMLVLLDVYLESSHLQNSETLGPSEFRNENLFSSPSRGRNRRQPFQYQAGGGGHFTQRY